MNGNNLYSQNDILLNKLMSFYNKNDNLNKMLNIINGNSKISLRIVDWFSTNYSKKYFTMYDIHNKPRFKVYEDYKLMLKAYSKKGLIHFVDGKEFKYQLNKVVNIVLKLQ